MKVLISESESGDLARIQLAMDPDSLGIAGVERSFPAEV
jgi:hypothetical protein